MDSKRAIMATTDFLPFGELVEVWAGELGVEPGWLRHEAIVALQEGRLSLPSAVRGRVVLLYMAPGLELRDRATFRRRKIDFGADVLAVGGEQQRADIAARLEAEGKRADPVDISEIVTGCELLVVRRAVVKLAQHWGVAPPSFVAGAAAPEAAKGDVVDQLVAFLKANPGLPEEKSTAKCKAMGLEFTKREMAEARARAPESKLRRGRPPKNPIRTP
jgi:hypothetical protein